MSKAKKKTEELIHKYRMLLMNEGEDYGEEILVSVLSVKMALVCVEEILNSMDNCCSAADGCDCVDPDFWMEVKQEIEKL